MRDYVIFTDSACDIKPELLSQWGVPYRNLTFRFEGEDTEYSNDDMSVVEFYNKMREGGVAKTAAVNAEAFAEMFEEEALKQGKDVLYLGFSSGLSTTYNSARIASIDLKEKYPDAKFKLLGMPCTLSIDDLKEYIDGGIVEYLGVTNDVRPYIEESSVHVLPTYYREGLVVVNMEASSMGRPLITCDNVGTRETVKDGYSGFLVKTKDANAIAEKMIYFLENPEKVSEMGKNAREYAKENFDHKIINEKICKIIGLI